MIPVALRRRLQGVLFLAVVIALVALSIAKYSGTFSRGVPVTHRIGHDVTAPQLRALASLVVQFGEGELRATN